MRPADGRAASVAAARPCRRGGKGQAVADPYYGGDDHFDDHLERRQRRRARRWPAGSAARRMTAFARRVADADRRSGGPARAAGRRRASPKCCWCAGPTGAARSRRAARRSAPKRRCCARSPAPAFRRRWSRASMTACCCSSMSRMTRVFSAKAWADIGAGSGGCTIGRARAYGWPVDYALGTVDARQSREPGLAALLGRAEAGRDRGLLDRPWRERVERLAARLGDLLPAEPPAALLHGDLWTRQHPRPRTAGSPPWSIPPAITACRSRPGDARPVRLAARRIPARPMARSSRAGGSGGRSISSFPRWSMCGCGARPIWRWSDRLLAAVGA